MESAECNDTGIEGTCGSRSKANCVVHHNRKASCQFVICDLGLSKTWRNLQSRTVLLGPMVFVFVSGFQQFNIRSLILPLEESDPLLLLRPEVCSHKTACNKKGF